MREIKFRAWIKEEKKYVNLLGFVKNVFEDSIIRLYVIDQDNNILAIPYRDNEIEIEQFTGLRDKNGKEIYEGDILRWTGSSTGLEYIKPVIFYQGTFCLEIPEINNFVLIGRAMNKFEIIGNIHENKMEDSCQKE